MEVELIGRSETEQNEIRDKIIDGLNAVKNSALHGYLPGGGVSLLHSSKLLNNLYFENFDEKVGSMILSKALCEPFVTIANNSGLNGIYWKEKILEENNWQMGLCLNSVKKSNMIADGVIDSYKNVSNYLDDACSIGSYFLTIDCVIANQKYYETPKLNSFKKHEI